MIDYYILKYILDTELEMTFSTVPKIMILALKSGHQRNTLITTLRFQQSMVMVITY